MDSHQDPLLEAIDLAAASGDQLALRQLRSLAHPLFTEQICSKLAWAGDLATLQFVRSLSPPCPYRSGPPAALSADPSLSSSCSFWHYCNSILSASTSSIRLPNTIHCCMISHYNKEALVSGVHSSMSSVNFAFESASVPVAAASRTAAHALFAIHEANVACFIPVCALQRHHLLPGNRRRAQEGPGMAARAGMPMG